METIEQYAVPRYLYDALQTLRPPEDLTVSEWADKYRRLDIRNADTPGQWRNDRTPYLKEIMDTLNEYGLEKTVVVSAAQIGKTEAMNNQVGYAIQQDPAPMLIVYPSDKLAEFTSENRLVPMIRACPSLAKAYDPLRSQKLELQFTNMVLTLVGSNSPANLASRAIKYLFMDEVDKFPGASKKEADPISLAMERVTTFHNSKIFMCSTPTLKEGRIWRELQGCDAEKHYFVPCPHCGEMIELVFSNLTWPDSEELTIQERADQAVYACQACGSAISDYHKDKMLREGEWRVVRETNPVHRSVGFWISALYSPFVRFSKMAYECMISKDDPEMLQNFVNSKLAEPWEDRVNGTSADLVMERQTELEEFTVPKWGFVLTGGVDVQQDRIYYTIRAWGESLTSQNVTHGVAMSWAELEQIMNTPYVREDGVKMQVSLCFIDSGFSSDEVYDFCANNKPWAIPVKGSSNPMTTPISRSQVEITNGRTYSMERVRVDTGLFKDWIGGRMKRPNGPGSWMVHKDTDKDYAQQVTSEHKVRERAAGGRTKEVWRPKRSHADNHYLDCEVYAFAAAHRLRVRSVHADQED